MRRARRSASSWCRPRIGSTFRARSLACSPIATSIARRSYAGARSYLCATPITSRVSGLRSTATSVTSGLTSSSTFLPGGSALEYPRLSFTTAR